MRSDLPTAWDRLPGETPKAHNGLMVYLTMGPGQRSLRKVAEQTGHRRATVELWSTKYSWAARARAYDEAGAVELAERRRSTVVEQREAVAKLASAGLGKVVKWLQESGDRQLKPGEMVRLLDVCANIIIRLYPAPTQVELSGNVTSSADSQLLIAALVGALGNDPEALDRALSAVIDASRPDGEVA